MQIRLKKEWMKSPAGTVLTINSHIGQMLINRGTAEEVKPESEVKAEIKKAVKSPSKNKMVIESDTKSVTTA